MSPQTRHTPKSDIVAATGEGEKVGLRRTQRILECFKQKQTHDKMLTSVHFGW